jgi:hypothetical protein
VGLLSVWNTGVSMEVRRLWWEGARWISCVAVVVVIEWMDGVDTEVLTCCIELLLWGADVSESVSSFASLARRR